MTDRKNINPRRPIPSSEYDKLRNNLSSPYNNEGPKNLLNFDLELEMIHFGTQMVPNQDSRCRRHSWAARRFFVDPRKSGTAVRP